MLTSNRSLCVLLLGLAVSLCFAEEPLKTKVDQSGFDKSVKPGDDFFQYVDGGWVKANPIPPQYGQWGSFVELHQRNETALREILDDVVKKTTPLTEDEQRLRNYWRAATDETALEKQGVTPIADELKQIANLQKAEDLPALLAQFHSHGLEFLFFVGAEQDAKKSDRYAVHVGQSGLGLPERGYYLDDSEEMQHTRALYLKHMAKMLELLGDAPADASAGADAVMRIETALAKVSRAPTALRDPEANYNLKTIDELETLCPGMHWKNYLQTIGGATAKDVVVGQPEFFSQVNVMLKDVPVADWRTYLRWHLVSTMARFLSPTIERESFDFNEGVMHGIKEMNPRWKRAMAAIDRQLGQPLGKLYVEKYFPPAAKKRMDELVVNLRAAYKERIQTRDWMGPETKKQALIKLDRIDPKIGYPTKWKDYSKLKTTPDSFCRNALAAIEFNFRYHMDRLDQPVDHTEWGMTPPTVNAYYNSSKNEIVFPAGILQPPFFDLNADDAFNYGAIGAVIGHEITHGFDDKGSQSDADGNLKNWWTKEDRERFDAKTAKLAKQYDDCVAVDGLHVNGRLTLGENLADLGGITIAYAAYMRSLDGKPAPVIDGFTGPQRFFIGYATVWRGQSRSASEKVQLRTNPHSPVRFRATIPLSNFPAFYEAFDVKPGDKMYRKPEDRVEVW